MVKSLLVVKWSWNYKWPSGPHKAAAGLMVGGCAYVVLDPLAVQQKSKKHIAIGCNEALIMPVSLYTAGSLS